MTRSLVFVSFTLFLDEFGSLSQKLIHVVSTGPLGVTGDFNFHLNNPSDRAAARFREMLDVVDLNGQILDLVITRAGDQPVRNVRVSNPVISQHCAVRWEAPYLKKTWL